MIILKKMTVNMMTKIRKETLEFWEVGMAEFFSELQKV